MNYTGGATPEQLRAGQVSADYFKLFGAKVFRGRTFAHEEDLPNGAKVAVLSHGLWVRRFGSDPNIIGKTILLSGDPHEVIGIGRLGRSVLSRPFDAVDDEDFHRSASRLEPQAELLLDSCVDRHRRRGRFDR